MHLFKFIFNLNPLYLSEISAEFKLNKNTISVE